MARWNNKNCGFQKGQKFTDEHRRKLSLAHIGKSVRNGIKHSKESKEKMSNVWVIKSKLGLNNGFKKGIYQGFGFKKGHKINVGKKFTLGRKHTEIEKKKVALSVKKSHEIKEYGFKKGVSYNKKEPTEYERNLIINLYQNGESINNIYKKVKHSKEYVRRILIENNIKIDRINKGFIPWNKGKEVFEIKGEKNPAWLGGKSFEPYTIEFNKEFKNLVRLRDNFCCLNCGISEQKHLILFGKRLASHHIDYNKKNTCLQNCCSLCNNCHGLTSHNRKHWKEFLQNKLSKLYNYNYLNEVEAVLYEKV